jgi:tRNA 2-thiouridine synthesizing protein A
MSSQETTPLRDTTPQDISGETLDTRGLHCPMPALLARRRLRALAPGAALMVLADDPMAAIDIPHMCRSEGFEVLRIEKGDPARLWLRRP